MIQRLVSQAGSYLCRPVSNYIRCAYLLFHHSTYTRISHPLVVVPLVSGDALWNRVFCRTQYPPSKRMPTHIYNNMNIPCFQYVFCNFPVAKPGYSIRCIPASIQKWLHCIRVFQVSLEFFSFDQPLSPDPNHKLAIWVAGYLPQFVGSDPEVGSRFIYRLNCLFPNGNLLFFHVSSPFLSESKKQRAAAG